MLAGTGPVDAVLEFMAGHNVSLHDLLCNTAGSSQPHRREHFLSSYGRPHSSHVSVLLNIFLADPATSRAVSDWTYGSAKATLHDKMKRLTQVNSGFHFNALHVRTTAIASFSLRGMSQEIQRIAPYMWDLVMSLMDVNASRQQRHARTKQAVAALPPTMFAALEASADEEKDDAEYWGELEELTDAQEAYLDKLDPARALRQRFRALTRQQAIQPMRATAIISILMQSSNGQCNGLAAVLGFFMQSRHAPEAVIETFAHLGLSVAPTTIRSMIDSLAADNSSEILSLANRHILNFGYDNLNLAFRTSQPTVQRQNSWFNVTSGTFLALSHAAPRDLMVSAELWDKSPLNYQRDTGVPVFRMEYTDIVKLMPPRSYPASIYAFHARRILVQNSSAFVRFVPELGTHPDGTASDVEIPVTRTIQFPARTMRIDESTNDAQAAILSDMLAQAGFSDRLDELGKFIMLVHGDLATLEKIDALIKSRRIEDSPAERLQWVLGIPGMFHTKMAAADALWRIYIQPFVSLAETTSVYAFACKLRPKETAKIGSKPTYRQLHDIIQHVTSASILDCWTRVASELGFSSLDEYAASRPSWKDIVQLSQKLVHRFVAGELFNETRLQQLNQRDQEFENSQLWHRDAILYLELCHASTHGHIGRVEKNLAFWIFIFSAVGKHKYSSYLSRFLTTLNHVLPPAAARAVRLNWLCNPTGKADGFRGIDWLLEINNMLQKTIHSGEGSNRTLDHIIKHSPLIELYRVCLTQIENNFRLTHRYIRHQPPDMTVTIRELVSLIVSKRIHHAQPGRKAAAVVPNQLTAGMAKLQQDKALVVKLDGVPDDVELSVTTSGDEEFADLLTDEDWERFIDVFDM